MKKVLLFIFCTIIVVAVFAQAPQSMDFQSIIRDSKGNLVTNQAIGLRISILKGGVSGTSVYSETHNATTNNGGLVTVTIGKGTTSDDFSAIEWGSGTYFVKTEVDVTGGTNYTLSATNQMLSVPYALYADKAGNYDAKLAELEKKLDSVKVAADKRDTLTSSEFEEIKQKLVTDMTFTVPKTTIKLNETMQIVADPLPWHTTKVAWTTSDATVATVENGLVKPIHAGVITITATSGTVTKSTEIAVVLPGEFSVSASSKVRFAHGNLTFDGTFSPGYYDASCYGTWNVLSEQYITSTIDKNPTYETGASAVNSWDKRSSTPSLNDEWYALTIYEWDYLINKRSNNSKLYSIGKVGGTEVLIILPDNWIQPQNLTFTPSSTNFDTNTYSIEQWKSMENAGAICLTTGSYGCRENHISGYAGVDVAYFYAGKNIIIHSTYYSNLSGATLYYKIRLVQKIK